MQFTATQIAQIINGTIEGNESAIVGNFAKIEEATDGDLCFLSNPKYNQYLYTTQASIAIVNADLELTAKVKPTLIRVANAYSAFAILLQQYEAISQQAIRKSGIETPSYISNKAQIGSNAYIAAFAYIDEDTIIGDNVYIYPNVYIGKNVRIGNNVTLHAGVKIYYDCILGNNILLHAGTVIGSDGFGFAYDNGVMQKIPQIGNVCIHDDVEMGANCCVDRATLGSTIIEQGVKLDNLVQVAHNVVIGKHSVIAGLSAIAGSTKLGENVTMGGQSGVIGHLTIAKGTKINGHSGVNKSIEEENSIVSGSPSFDLKTYLKSSIIFRNLPNLQQRINDIEATLTIVQNKLEK
jgi:UDP-3-O-[3-hydroxymyristoyl] glucosamine N-acyltransferase